MEPRTRMGESGVVDTQETELAAPDLALAEHLSAQDWNRFIAAEIARNRAAYGSQPKFLTGHFRGEKQIADDYAGRELLELVQNAADAAAESGGRGRVRIALWSGGLLVANTGAPFRPGGVQSLMAVHASDKPGRKAALIGAKGLGFRALLNWSHEPVISSGHLEMAFSRRHAVQRVLAMGGDDPEIAALCAVEDEEDFPAPVLAFPAVGEAVADLGGQAGDLLVRARAMRAEGFDTVVAAAFDDETRLDWARKQIAEFEPTFLLFVPALTEIRIEVEGQPSVTWSREDTGPEACDLVIETGDPASVRTATQNWICLHEAGSVALRNRKKPHLFAMAFALRLDEPNAPGVLHTYFPTSVPLPFPGLFHATLELDSSRKLFKANSDLNAQVLARLAAFHARALWELVKDGRVANALDFLDRRAPFPESLKAFEAAAYAAAALLPLIPTMKGGRAPAAKTRLGPPGYETWMPKRLFGDLARRRSLSDQQTLERLGVSIMEPAEAVGLLKRAELTLEERAAVVLGVAEALPSELHAPALLLDDKGRSLASTNTAFPPPVGDEDLPRLPDWAKARFVLPALWRLILRRAEGQPTRDVIRKLSAFGLTEYSNESVIAALRGQAAKALSNGRRDPDVVQRELLATLYRLYSPLFRPPPGVFYVRCRDGDWRDTREVHLSQGYGLAGEITAVLYADRPSELVALPADNGLPAEGGVADFLIWLGVHSWPRTALTKPGREFAPVVLRSLPNPVVFQDQTAQTVTRSSLSWDYTLQVTARTIVGLSTILSSAPSDAILAWLAHDPRFDPATPDAFPTTAQGRKDGKSAWRPWPGVLPAFVQHQIQTTPWLEGRDGIRHAPADCMVNPGRLGALFHRPRPALASSDVGLGLSAVLWRRGLEHAGVPQGLAELPVARFVALMTALPDRDVTPDVVTRFYRQVLELETLDMDADRSGFEAFLARGRVQVLRGRERAWVSPGEALYADRDGFPAAAREHLALIELPPRQNIAHVLERFGVPPLSRQTFSLTVTGYEADESLVAAALRLSFDDARPFIAALRQAVSHDQSHQKRFERLRLVVARSAGIEVEIGDRRIAGELDPWTHALQDDALIVGIEAWKSPEEVFALASEAIADGLAEVFRIQNGADFVKLLTAGSDGLRRLLLKRMVPHCSDTELELLLGGRGEEEDHWEPVQIDAAALAKGPATGPNVTSAPGAPVAPEASPTPPPPSAPSGPGRRAPPTGVTSAPLAPPAAPAQMPGPRRRPQSGFRIGRLTGALTGGAVHDPHRAGDAELWSMLYEESEGRFPLTVAHLQGPGAYGCDCLSFETAEARAAFEADPKATHLVARFIETKSGQVRLEPSQVIAAERRRDKFFVYRIDFYSGSREYAELTIVCDPLREKAALITECVLELDKVTSSTRVKLAPEPA